jgi:large subunit ribosomal protein L18
MAKSPREAQLKRAERVRIRLKKVANGRPRLSVHRSNKNIYAQVIDDQQGVTLAAAPRWKARRGPRGADKESAARIGRLVAERAKEKGVTDVVSTGRLHLPRPDQGAGGSRA